MATPDPVRLGVVVDGDLVGGVELLPVDPPRYCLGYWLASQATGCGYATDAVAVVLDHAQVGLGASDGYAGVTYGIDSSEAVLRRLSSRQPLSSIHRRWHPQLDEPARRVGTDRV